MHIVHVCWVGVCTWSSHTIKCIPCRLVPSSHHVQLVLEVPSSHHVQLVLEVHVHTMCNWYWRYLVHTMCNWYWRYLVHTMCNWYWRYLVHTMCNWYWRYMYMHAVYNKYILKLIDQGVATPICAILTATTGVTICDRRNLSVTA